MAMSLRWIFSVKFPGKVSVYLHRRENKVRAMTGIFEDKAPQNCFLMKMLVMLTDALFLLGCFFLMRSMFLLDFSTFIKRCQSYS